MIVVGRTLLMIAVMLATSLLQYRFEKTVFFVATISLIAGLIFITWDSKND